MKKALCLAVFCLLSPVVFAQITDPLFMPEKGRFLAETSFSVNSVYRGLGDNFPLFAKDPKIFVFKQGLSYAFTDKLTFGAAIGYGKVKADANPELTSQDLDAYGFTDPEFTLRYRVSEDLFQDMLFDVIAYVRPSIFNSYMVNKKSFDLSSAATVDIHSGPAQGSDEYSLTFLTGKRVDNISFAFKAGGGFISDIELVDNFKDQWAFFAGTDIRYYFLPKHALGLTFSYNRRTPIIGGLSGAGVPDVQRDYTLLNYGASYDFNVNECLGFTLFYTEQVFDLPVLKHPKYWGLSAKVLF